MDWVPEEVETGNVLLLVRRLHVPLVSPNLQLALQFKVSDVLRDEVLLLNLILALLQRALELPQDVHGLLQ